MTLTSLDWLSLASVIEHLGNVGSIAQCEHELSGNDLAFHNTEGSSQCYQIERLRPVEYRQMYACSSATKAIIRSQVCCPSDDALTSLRIIVLMIDGADDVVGDRELHTEHVSIVVRAFLPQPSRRPDGTSLAV